MNDINMSSKTRNIRKPTSSGKKSWHYLFDLIFKTLLCSAVISVNFTLFANSGNYNMFSTGVYGNIEALYIYGGIVIISFILIFISSLMRPLENILLSAVFGLFAIAVVNQFATFEKKSGLLLLFNDVFSNNINAILYEHFYLIVFSVVFLVFWILLSALNRSFVFYITLGVLACLGWLISEPYLNPNTKLFNEVAGLPNFKKKNMGKNIIFLSFNDLTSINNLKSMNNDKQSSNHLVSAYNNALGFYSANDFTLYPNALIEYPENAFYNLISSYNYDSTTEDIDKNILSFTYRDSYFDFTTLQSNKIHLKNNALYDYLRKNEYKINVFQTRDIDTCYTNNKLTASSCKEKINSPISLNEENFTTFDKIVILTSQWLESTGLIESINPLLKLLHQTIPFIPSEFSPKNVELGKLYSYNSIRIFDQLIDTIDKLSGNQAYFAVIDLPSDNFVYDEFCKIKPVNNWMGTRSTSLANAPISKRKQSYAEQTNCLYGSLQKFIKQLDTMGELENTTIIIQGLNNPTELFGRRASYFEQIQGKRNVTFAVRQAYAKKADIDYSVCNVTDFIKSELIDEKNCLNYKALNTTDKNIEETKKIVENNKLDDNTINKSIKSFNDWFNVWSIQNDFVIEKSTVSNDNIIETAPVMDEVINDIPENEMESISTASDSSNIEEKSEVTDNETQATAKEVTKEASNKVLENAVAEVEDVKAIEETPEVETSKDGEKIEELNDNEKIEEPKKNTKIEELAKNTFDKINAEVNNIKNKEIAGNNLIEKINTVTGDISSNIDNTFKNIGKKVVKVIDETKSKVADTANEDAIKKQPSDDIVENIDDIVEEKQNNIEDIIAKAKKTVKEKEENNYKRQTIEAHLEVKEKVSQQSDELRRVLEAPVADGQDLSPDELKRIYRDKIKEAVKKSNIKVKVIEK